MKNILLNALMWGGERKPYNSTQERRFSYLLEPLFNKESEVTDI